MTSLDVGVGLSVEAVEVGEAPLLGMEIELYVPYRAVAVLIYQDVGNVLAVGLFVVVGFTVDKHHYVGVLLDGAGVAEVGQLWYGRSARLNGAGELGEGD